MKIEVKDLMNEREMLSHVFFNCLERDQIIAIKEKFIGTTGNEIDWQKESVKIPVEMKIGGISVNPKEFFKAWENQMENLILDKAKELLSEKLGSKKMGALQNKIYELENILENFESEINWDVKNPFI